MARPTDVTKRIDNQNLSDSSSKGGKLGAVGKAAFGMAAFQIGIGVFRAATGKLNSGIGNILGGLRASGGMARMAKAAPKGARNVIKQFSKAITKTPDAMRNVGRTLPFTKLIQQTRGFKTSGVGKFVSRMNKNEGRALHSIKKLQATKQSTLYGAAKAGYQKGQAGFGQASQARLWRFAKEQAPIFPLFYGIHRIQSRAETDRKKWYDPRAIGKYAKSYTGSMLMFGGAGSALKAVGNSHAAQAVKSGVVNKFGSAIAKSVTKSIDFADRHRGTRPAAFIDAMQETRATTHPTRAGSAGGFFKRIIKGVDKFKESYKTNKTRYRANRNTKGDIEFHDQKLAEIAAEDTEGFFTAHASRALKADAKAKSSKSMKFLNSLMGKKRLKVDTFRSSAGDTLRRGSGFVTMDGQSKDISSWMPKNIIKTGMNVLKQTRMFGHSPTSLMNIGSLAEWNTNQQYMTALGGSQGATINLSHSYGSVGEMVNPITKESIAMTGKQRNAAYLNSINANREASYHWMGSGGADQREGAIHTSTDELLSQKTIGMRGLDQPDASEKISKMAINATYGAGHGKFVVGPQQKVHSVMGRLYLQSQPGGADTPNRFFELGMHTGTGNAMRYRSLPMRSGGVFTSVHDKYMGSTDFDDGTKVGFGGISQSGDAQAGVKGRTQQFMAEKFDLGGKGRPSIFGRIASFFKSSKNPKENRVSHSKEMLRSSEASLDYSSASAVDSKIHGARFARSLDKLHGYSYGKVFGESDNLESAANFMGQNNITGAQHLIRPEQMKNLSTEQLQEYLHNATSGFTTGKQMSKEFQSAKSALMDLSKGLNNRSMHDTSRKIGNVSISLMDEWNSAVMGDALSHVGAGNITKLAGQMSGKGTGQMLRAFQQTSNKNGASFSKMFSGIGEAPKGHNNAMMQFRNLIRDNQEAADIMLKHTDPISKMGSASSSGLFSGNYIAENRHQLFIPEKLDVKGMPVNDGLMSSIFPKLQVGGDGRALPGQTLTMGGLVTGAGMASINNTANVIGVGFSTENSRTVGMFAKNLLTKRALPMMGAMALWSAADAITDESSVFDNTALGEGLNVFMASQLMKARLAGARVMDMTGVTYLSRKAEDLMPGSISSPISGAVRGFGSPLAGASLGMKLAGPAGGLVGGAVGGIVSLLTAGGPLATLGSYDITKSRKELIEEYSGRNKVAHKTDKGWLLGSTSLLGSNVKGFVPNWYARMRSGYRHTPTLYGSKMERAMTYLDPGHFEEKNYNSRPYPTSAGLLSNVPLVSNLISFGNKQMHADELEALRNLPNGSAEGFANARNMPSLGEDSQYQLQDTSHQFIDGTTTLPKAAAVGASSGTANAQNLFYGTAKMVGLRGFSAQVALEKATGSNVPFADIPVEESAANMTSKGRFFWEQGLGDSLGTTEVLRRFYPRRSFHTDYDNPLRNLMPDWLPDKYKKGDPYTKDPLGEIRLPGAGYESANDVNLTFPADVSVVGADVEETAANYLFGTKESSEDYEMKNRTKIKIAQSLGGANGTAQIDSAYFDAKLNLSGKADVSSNGVSYKIKTLNAKQFQRISEVTPDLKAQLDLLNGLTKGSSGVAVYVNAETGETKEFNVASDKNSFADSISMLQAGRQKAEQMSGDPSLKPNMNLANAYSRMDRLKILADVAPTSEAYYTTMKEVQGESKYNYTENYENDIEDLQKKQFIRTQPRELYPYRFTKTPDNTSDLISQRNSVDSEYGMVARTVGGAWEKFAHMNTPIHRKFLDINSPYEAYDRNMVHGKEVKLWNHPYQHFLRPYMSNMGTQDSVGQNMTSGAFGGMIFGGPVGAAIGAAAGGTVAAFNSAVHGERGIPGYRQKQRDIEATLDDVEHDKLMSQYQMTGDEQYLQQAKGTMKYFNTNMNTLDIGDMKKAAPYSEQKYLTQMLQTSNQEERASILQTVPDALKPGINKYWNKDRNEKENYLNETVQQQIKDISPDWAGYLPSTKMDLIKTKMLQEEGLDARDSGVGWHSQNSELARTAFVPKSFQSDLNVDVTSIQSALKSALASLGQVSVTVSPTMSEGVQVNLTIVRG